MEFSFEVDPNQDLAIGSEVSFDPEYSDLVDDVSVTDVDPLAPTGAKPGSEDKVRMLSARYAAGVPLWHDSDCYDHGPSDGHGLREDGELDADEDDDL